MERDDFGLNWFCGVIGLLVGKNSLGGDGSVSAYVYVNEWGGVAVSDYTHISFLLDQYLATQGTYIAATGVKSFPTIDSANITLNSIDTVFNLINVDNHAGNSTNYQGTIRNFMFGQEIDVKNIVFNDE